MIRVLCRMMLLALVVSLTGCKKVDTPPAAPAKVEAKVKAGDLMNEFAANSLAAESKFKGKVIQVTGKVASVQKVLLAYEVLLVPDDAPSDVTLSGVHCFLSEAAKDDAAKLKQGEPATMQGTCDGAPLGGQIKMSKCTVVK